MVVYSHYCMGRFIGAEWFVQQEKDACDQCGMDKTGETENNCCSDEQHVAKITDDQKISLPWAGLDKPLLVDLNPIAGFTSSVPVPQEQSPENGFMLPPPDYTGPPLSIVHCSFLI